MKAIDKLTGGRTISMLLMDTPVRPIHKPSMSQSEKPKPPAPSTRQQTPRVPSNVFYDRVLPVVLVAAAIVLVIILIVVVLGAGQTY
jgi:hypothetical protein